MEFKTGGGYKCPVEDFSQVPRSIFLGILCPGEKSSINTLDHQQKYKTLLIWATSTENVLINKKNAKKI